MAKPLVSEIFIAYYTAASPARSPEIAAPRGAMPVRVQLSAVGGDWWGYRVLMRGHWQGLADDCLNNSHSLASFLALVRPNLRRSHSSTTS
jgi:hypothetical protein